MTNQNVPPNGHVFTVHTYTPILMILPCGGDEYLAQQMVAKIYMLLLGHLGDGI